MLVGAALGFLYAPCAGPILAAVISVAATGGASGEVVLVAIGYGLGSAVVLLALAYGGRRVIERLRGRGGAGPPARAGGRDDRHRGRDGHRLDLRFQTVLANDVPSFIANPTGGLERSSAVEHRLADLRGRPKFDVRDHTQLAAAGSAATRCSAWRPAFAGKGPWLNTPGGRPLKSAAAGEGGADRLLDLHVHQLPAHAALRERLVRPLREGRAHGGRRAHAGVPVREDAGNVGGAIARDHLHYPVFQDNDYATWTAWGNQYWPAKYLIDGLGRVRYTHFGEGDYDKTETAIRTLLRETGHSSLGGYTQARGQVASRATSTPETYIGYSRAQGFVPSAPTPGCTATPRLARFPRTGSRWAERGRRSRVGHGRGRRDARRPLQRPRVLLVLSSEGDRRASACPSRRGGR